MERCIDDENDKYGYNLRFNKIYIREPEDPINKLIIEKHIIKNVVEYVDKEVVKEVEKIVFKKMKDLDDCGICYNKKGYISFGCCNFKQCAQCCIKICETKKCPQCRLKIKMENIKSIVDNIS